MQVSGILPHVLLPVEGVASRATCEALQALVLAGCFDGSVVCPAGMNILHYIVMQPALLTERRNATLRLIDLAIKLGPNVNGQVRTLRIVQTLRQLLCPGRATFRALVALV